MNQKSERRWAVPVVLAFTTLSSGCVVSQNKYNKLQNQESSTEASLASSQQQASDLTKQIGDLRAKIAPLERERDQLAATLKAKEDEFLKLVKKVQDRLDLAQSALADYIKQGAAATAAPVAPAAPTPPPAPTAPKQIDRPAPPTDPN